MNARWHVTPRFASFIDNKNKTCSGTIIALSSCKKQEKGGGSYECRYTNDVGSVSDRNNSMGWSSRPRHAKGVLRKAGEARLEGLQAEGMELNKRREIWVGD